MPVKVGPQGQLELPPAILEQMHAHAEIISCAASTKDQVKNHKDSII